MGPDDDLPAIGGDHMEATHILMLGRPINRDRAEPRGQGDCSLGSPMNAFDYTGALPAGCSAKAPLGTLTQVLGLEFAEHGITVNAFAAARSRPG